MPKKANDSTPDPEREERRRTYVFLAMVAAVGGILLLGAVLRSGRPEEPLLPSPPSATAPALPTTEAPLPAPSTADPAGFPPESLLDVMARRAGDDVARLAGEGPGWTAQLAVLCDPRRVREIVDSHGDSAGLLVLPASLDERPCFRVCWGPYGSRDEASRAADLPPGLRATIDGDPLPRRVAEVLE